MTLLALDCQAILLRKMRGLRNGCGLFQRVGVGAQTLDDGVDIRHSLVVATVEARKDSVETICQHEAPSAPPISRIPEWTQQERHVVVLLTAGNAEADQDVGVKSLPPAR